MNWGYRTALAAVAVLVATTAGTSAGAQAADEPVRPDRADVEAYIETLDPVPEATNPPALPTTPADGAAASGGVLTLTARVATSLPVSVPAGVPVAVSS